MAFTGILGSQYSKLGNFALARIPVLGPPVDPLEPHVISDLDLNQTVATENTLNISVGQTLTLTQVGEKTPGFPAIVGYTGGQTRYAYSIDVDANQELHKLNEDTVFNYPASITKLMTALLIMEYKEANLSDVITITAADVSIFGGASTASLLANDTLDWEALLYAILTQSGGDACQAAARIIGTEIYVAAGSTGNTGRTRFHERMNERADELGMTNTFYYDSWGESTLSGSVRNSTTARDVATLLAACIEYPTLCTVMGTPTKSQAIGGPNARTLDWANVNRLVNGPANNPQGIKLDNVIGGKVGEWNGDGVHVNLANAWIAPNGNRIVTVVMNATLYQTLSWDHQGLMYSAILDWPYLMEGVGEELDPDFDTVKLLMTSDGTNIVDESSFGLTVTTSGATSGDPFLYGSEGSIELASTHYARVADSVEFEITSGDATLETWFKAPIDNNVSLEQLFFLKATTGSLEVAMNWFPNAFQVFASSTGTGWSWQIFLSTNDEIKRTFFNGAPRHVAWVKSGSSIKGYLNGEQFASGLSIGTIPNGTGPIGIGGDGAAISAVGTYGDFRVSIGLARYTDEMVTLMPVMFPRSSVAATPSSNSLTLSHTVGLSKDVERSVEHTLSLTHAAYKVIDEDVEHTLVLTHDLTFEKYKLASASSALALTQDAPVELSYEREVHQGLPINHAATRNIYRVVSASNALAANQLAVAIVTRPTNNVLSLSDLAEAVVSKVARNLLEVTQSLSREVDFNRSTADNFIPFQTLAVELTIRRSLENVLPLAQTLVGFVVKSAFNVLSMTQSATATVSKSASNTLVPTQTAAFSRSFGKTVTTPVPLVQTVFVGKAKAVDVQHAFGMNQFARGTRRLTTSVSDTLALAHELVQEYKYGDAEHTVALDQDIVVSKLAQPTAENTLTLSQTVEVAKTLVRTIVDTLVFQNSFEKYVGIGGHETVSVPAVQVVKVKKVVVLQSDTLVIVLPAPEFNDSEGGTGRINIKRTMAGGRRIYTRDNVTSRLNYQFIIDRKKAIELRNFIMNSNTKFLRMENWKGEIWACQMTNSPFSFGEDAAWLGSPGGNKSSITLEFEGVRLN
jgi:D-alanyl-D-alanine carboxypeptidase